MPLIPLVLLSRRLWPSTREEQMMIFHKEVFQNVLHYEYCKTTTQHRSYFALLELDLCS